MIDEKINNSLKELEQDLKDIESARKQVEKTVRSYDGLNKTTGEYVTKLGTITTKIQELVNSIDKDYSQKLKNFEKDRDSIINAANTATEKLSMATEEFNNTLPELKSKTNQSLVFNVISSIIVIILLLILLFMR